MKLGELLSVLERNNWRPEDHALEVVVVMPDDKTARYSVKGVVVNGRDKELEIEVA
jgi:hypothetical protein